MVSISFRFDEIRRLTSIIVRAASATVSPSFSSPNGKASSTATGKVFGTPAQVELDLNPVTSPSRRRSGRISRSPPGRVGKDRLPCNKGHFYHYCRK